jgi:hypothetical protein
LCGGGGEKEKGKRKRRSERGRAVVGEASSRDEKKQIQNALLHFASRSSSLSLSSLHLMTVTQMHHAPALLSRCFLAGGGAAAFFFAKCCFFFFVFLLPPPPPQSESPDESPPLLPTASW